MSKISFENYGRLSGQCDDPTRISGRYLCQREDERNIVKDIVRKLRIRPQDNCLEIGCGAGNLLIPLSFMVDSVTGIDHPNCIAVLSERFKGDNVHLIGRNFLDCDKGELGYFDVILIYSVLHYLTDSQEVFDFINKALGMLRSGGRFLLGDIPNTNKKMRFVNSEKGREFDQLWKKKVAAEKQNAVQSELSADPRTVTFDDALVLSIVSEVRCLGHHAYILPQPDNLPCGHTREDILIEKL